MSDYWQEVERRKDRVLDDERAETHLRRLGVNPTTVARLRGYAEQDEIRLREFVSYVLSSYAPPEFGTGEEV